MANEKERQLPVQREEERMPSRAEGFFDSPFQMMRRMREEMNRLFEDFGYGPTLAPLESEVLTPVGIWSPACDVWETDSDIKIRCELPGVEPDNIELYTTEDSIQIRARSEQREEEKERGFYRAERHYGTFQRQFLLPTDVQADQAKASFRNGILEVTLPKTEEAKEKMKKVPIEVAEEEKAGTKGGKRER